MLTILIAVFVVGFTFFMRMSSQGYDFDSKENTANLPSGNEQTSVQQKDLFFNGDSTKKEVSLQELAPHNSQSDCWVAYDGKVYDITSFLPNHPGTAGRIIPYCGTAKEFQKAFVRQHGTKQVSLLMSVGTFIGDFDIIGDVSK